MNMILRKLLNVTLLAAVLGAAGARAAEVRPPAGSQGPGLDAKLEAQWQLYAQAREALLRQVRRTDIKDPAERAIPRAEWEKLLALPENLAFTPQDIAELRSRQALRIQKARELAKKRSVIDLDKVRAAGGAEKFCAKVPKGGMLHIHPYGTLGRAQAAALLKELDPVLDLTEVFLDIQRSSGNVTLYPEETAWLKTLPPATDYLSLSAADQERFASLLFLPPGKQPFPRFNGVFEFIGFAAYDNKKKASRFPEVMMTFAKRAAEEGVSYVEFTDMASPRMYARIAALEKETGLVIRLNNSFARSRDLAALRQDQAAFLAAATSQYLVGMDFLDNEEKFPALEAGQLLYGEALRQDLAGERKLHRTMHAGEIGDPRNPRDAMIMGAGRLGHGVNLAKDPVALEYAARLREPVEINLASNLRLTDVGSVKEHPFLDFLRLGLPVSLSTDDEGILDTDIDRECVLAVEQTDMTYAEFRQMAFNSIETSFASDADKKALLKKLAASFKKFEKTAKY